MVKKRAMRAGEISASIDCGYRPSRALPTASGSTSLAKICSLISRLDSSICSQQQQHGEGIGLLAGTATGDPDSQWPIQRMIAHEAGYDFLREKIEDRRVTEETRHVDQQIPGELLEFDSIPTDEFEIGFGGFDRRHRHPALDPRRSSVPCLLERSKLWAVFFRSRSTISGSKS